MSKYSAAPAFVNFYEIRKKCTGFIMFLFVFLIFFVFFEKF